MASNPRFRLLSEASDGSASSTPVPEEPPSTGSPMAPPPPTPPPIIAPPSPPNTVDETTVGVSVIAPSPPIPTATYKLCFTGQFLVADDSKIGTLRVWTLPSSAEVDGGAALTPSLVDAHGSVPIRGIVSPPPFTSVVTAGADGEVKVWSPLQDWKCVGSYGVTHAEIGSIGLFGDLVVIGEHHATGKDHGAVAGAGGASAPSLDDDGPAVPRSSDESSPPRLAAVVVLDPSKRFERVAAIKGAHSTTVTTIQDCDRRWLVTGGTDWVVRIWDAHSDWKLAREVVMAEDSLGCSTLLPRVFHNTALVTGGMHGRVQVWDVSTDWPLLNSIQLPEREDGTQSPNVTQLACVMAGGKTFVATGEAAGRCILSMYDEDRDEGPAWIVASRFHVSASGLTAMASIHPSDSPTDILVSLDGTGELVFWKPPAL